MSVCKNRGFKIFYFLLFALLTSVQAQQPVRSDTGKTYNMDTVIIAAHRQKEEAPTGTYKQPEWTLSRRFPSTRVYLQTPPGAVEFEQWLEVRVPKSSSEKTVTRLKQELAFGIDNHLQLDLYLNTEHVRDGVKSVFDFRGWSVEMRWALADWGNIPGNPTLYFEYLLNNGGPDGIEPKLLLGGELETRWHWGMNLIYEGDLTEYAKRNDEMAATGAISYTAIDQKLSVGASAEYSYAIERSAGESTLSRELLAGPSLQWKPVKNATLNIEPLFGITEEAKKLKMFVVFGWEF